MFSRDQHPILPLYDLPCGQPLLLGRPAAEAMQASEPPPFSSIPPFLGTLDLDFIQTRSRDVFLSGPVLFLHSSISLLVFVVEEISAGSGQICSNISDIAGLFSSSRRFSSIRFFSSAPKLPTSRLEESLRTPQSP